jgi:3'-phosphoadenosine 5'-phosphosulfate sulfotransferase (PAPS reductase)/FAD synthetase
LDDIEEKVKESITFIKKNAFDTIIAGLFSGGKDSLVALHLALQACSDKTCDVIAIHADTTVEIPDNINYINDVCKKLNVKLLIIKPDIDYFTLVKKWGFPRMKYRWCCKSLKIYPIKKALDEIRKEGKNVVVVDGIRAEESKVRSEFERISQHKIWKVLVLHPIFYWTKEDIKKYIELYLKPVGIDINPLYKLGFRRACECWCPVFKSEKDFELLAKFYPEIFVRLVELEKEAKSGFAYAYIKGRPFRLSELITKLKVSNPRVSDVSPLVRD